MYNLAQSENQCGDPKYHDKCKNNQAEDTYETRSAAFGAVYDGKYHRRFGEEQCCRDGKCLEDHDLGMKSDTHTEGGRRVTWMEYRHGNFKLAQSQVCEMLS
jgi:hypothetical protein